jgi:hypothetical protein
MLFIDVTLPDPEEIVLLEMWRTYADALAPIPEQGGE